MKIPVTRNFDMKPVGYLTLQDGIDLTADSAFALSYIVLEQADGDTPARIQVLSVSLTSKSNYERYLMSQQKEEPPV